MSCGGLSVQRPATGNIQMICDDIKGQAEMQTGRDFNTFKAKFYRTQVVNCIRYFIKVHVGGDEYLHLLVSDMPKPGVKPVLEYLEENKSIHAPIESF